MDQVSTIATEMVQSLPSQHTEQGGEKHERSFRAAYENILEGA